MFMNVRELFFLRNVDVDVVEECVRVFWRQIPLYTLLKKLIVDFVNVFFFTNRQLWVETIIAEIQ